MNKNQGLSLRWWLLLYWCWCWCWLHVMQSHRLRHGTAADVARPTGQEASHTRGTSTMSTDEHCGYGRHETHWTRRLLRHRRSSATAGSASASTSTSTSVGSASATSAGSSPPPSSAAAPEGGCGIGEQPVEATAPHKCADRDNVTRLRVPGRVLCMGWYVHTSQVVARTLGQTAHDGQFSSNQKFKPETKEKRLCS